MQENENNKEKNSEIDWKELDLITRRWAVMSQWENDQDKYKSLQEEISENVYRGYN
jgi:hypothetical protein